MLWSLRGFRVLRRFAARIWGGELWILRVATLFSLRALGPEAP